MWNYGNAKISCLKKDFPLNPYPATGKGNEMTPQRGFCWKSSSKQWKETAIFCDAVTDPLGFPTQLSMSLCLLPVLRGRFGSNVHVIGFATTSIVHLWSKDINFTYVIFLNVSDWKWGKMTGQKYRERYLYIFKMTDKTGSSNRSSSGAHSHSHRLIQLNKSVIPITVILEQ